MEILSRPNPIGIASDDVMAFEIQLTNLGPGSSSFYLYHETADNPRGLNIDLLSNDVGTWLLDGSDGKAQVTTVAVAKGPLGYLQYDPVRIHLQSKCEFDGEYGSAKFSVELNNVFRKLDDGTTSKFIEFTDPCPEVTFGSPIGETNTFFINTLSESLMTISILNPSIYKFPYTKLRDKMGLKNIWLEFRRKSDRTGNSHIWNIALGEKNEKLDFLLFEEINGAIVSKWKYPQVDGTYEIRLRSECSCNGCSLNMKRFTSESIFGDIDITPPTVFGKPTPLANLHPGEELSIAFTEELDCEFPFSFNLFILVSEIPWKLFTNNDFDILCDINTISIQFKEESIPGMDYKKLYGRSFTLSIHNIKDKSGNSMKEKYFFQSNFICLPPIPKLDISRDSTRLYLPHEPMKFQAVISNFQEKWVTTETLTMPQYVSFCL